MKSHIVCLILVVLILSACEEVRSITQASVTATPQVASSATKTLIPVLTSTAPTKVPTYTKSPPRPTLSPLDTAGMVLTELSIDETHALSPNGYCEWKRIIASSPGELSYKYKDQFFTYVTITCANQEKPWVLVEKWTEQGLGYPLTSLLGWSADNQYAYFYDRIVPDGCQPLGEYQQDLRQCDLNTGTIKSFQITWTGGMALSPDSSKVIYYDRQAVEVGIDNLLGQQEQRIGFELPVGLESWSAGAFTWSPDGQKAVFIIAYGDACSPAGMSLRLVDPQTSEVTSILEMENQTLSIVEWSEPNRVLIAINEEQQVLDLTMGKLSTP